MGEGVSHRLRLLAALNDHDQRLTVVGCLRCGDQQADVFVPLARRLLGGEQLRELQQALCLPLREAEGDVDLGCDCNRLPSVGSDRAAQSGLSLPQSWQSCGLPDVR